MFLDKLYYQVYYPYRIARLRKQSIITVAFKVENLGAWKSERVYSVMLRHPRFNPVLLVSRNAIEDDRDNIRAYCDKKRYPYIEADGMNHDIWDYVRPDIVFFQKPYRGTFDSFKHFILNYKTLFCYIGYALRGNIEEWSCVTPYLKKCWQIYYENKIIAEEYNSVLNPKIENAYVSGVPMMDELLLPKEEVENQWKPCQKWKKKIIYAPHHSIDVENKWQSSTFLEMGELMLDLAEKYSDQVQWAFKPHPLLREKLEKVWGMEKTDDYYNKWATASWSQYESGKYIGLFKHSDAMIHDCGSFILEYLYMGNPVMYLMRNTNLQDTFNSFYKDAFSLLYKGRTAAEVELFIQNTINGVDEMKAQRELFVTDCLLPPNQVSSTDNIINCILDHHSANKMRLNAI